MKNHTLEHRFIETAPAQLEAGVLYVSINYATTLHLCCCGCGNETVLPLRPKAWRLTFDGETVSMAPSIGNRFACRSHYWIDRDRVVWVKDDPPGRAEGRLRRGRREVERIARRLRRRSN